MLDAFVIPERQERFFVRDMRLNDTLDNPLLIFKKDEYRAQVCFYLPDELQTVLPGLKVCMLMPENRGFAFFQVQKGDKTGTDEFLAADFIFLFIMIYGRVFVLNEHFVFQPGFEILCRPAVFVLSRHVPPQQYMDKVIGIDIMIMFLSSG
jgi:hypothetical protein